MDFLMIASQSFVHLNKYLHCLHSYIHQCFQVVLCLPKVFSDSIRSYIVLWSWLVKLKKLVDWFIIFREAGEGCFLVYIVFIMCDLELSVIRELGFSFLLIVRANCFFLTKKREGKRSWIGSKIFFLTFMWHHTLLCWGVRNFSFFY